MKKFKNKVCKLLKHVKENALEYAIGFASLSLGGVCFAEAADPLAATVKPQIAALFGSGSTVNYAIYLGELIIGAVAYIKSKNLLVLAGVPILVLFTHGMFSYIAGS